MVVPCRSLASGLAAARLWREQEDDCGPRRVRSRERGSRRPSERFPMAHTSARPARADVYSRITDEIVAAIEKGAGDWRMPWHHDGGSTARPRNVASDKPYRGINILALW